MNDATLFTAQSVPVAQWIERWPAEPETGGSSPLGHAEKGGLACLQASKATFLDFHPLSSRLTVLTFSGHGHSWNRDR